MNKQALTIVLCLTSLLLTPATKAEDAKPANPPFTTGSVTLAILPDTERYSDDYPQHFHAQLEWIAEQHKARNIQYVLHLGDVTQHNAPKEWEVARKAFNNIHGKVPYILAAGNHDYDNNRPLRDTPRINEHFTLKEFSQSPTFGGTFENGKQENAYHLFKIHNQNWLILNLEMGPRDQVLDWANTILTKHPDHRTIILTHAYLFRNNVRYDHTLGSQRASPISWGNDGQQIWDKLARNHKNVMIILSGHVSTGGLGYLKSEGNYGNAVHQMMCDYEKMRGGGMGYLRLLEFLPDRKTVQVRTYSPVTKQTLNSKLEEFQFTLQGPTRTKPIRISDLPKEQLTQKPKYRYSFNGSGTQITESIQNKHAQLKLTDNQSQLNGKGQLQLKANDFVALPPDILKDFKQLSFELWLTPNADHYKWNAPVYLGDGNDWLTYTFRTRDVHRAEIAINKHNEDIQTQIPTPTGNQIHIVVTYIPADEKNKPQLQYYRDGKHIRTMTTNLKLSDVTDKHNRLGPFIGTYDEFRIYDYILTPKQVAGNHQHGPDTLNLAK